MKKSSLTTAVLAGLAGAAGLAGTTTAQELYLNPDGLGQVLIYPYYTVNGGNATLISVVNTTGDTKAVKVRFLEGRNSREVLDFNLYLSPFDVWTAQITDGGVADGPGRLSTSDTSCTVPGIPAAGVAFRNFQYGAGTNPLTNDDGPATLDRTREGYVEMIEMGVVLNDGEARDLTLEDDDETFASDATHAAGVPTNCGSLGASWASGAWATNAQIDMLPPAGGIFGAGAIVDVVNGTNLSYNADAIDGFFQNQGLAAPGYFFTLHTPPGSVLPNLGNAATVVGGDANSAVFINGGVARLEFINNNIGAVSSVFMYDAIYNEFVTSADLGASSEWVVTFPTKRTHIEGTDPYVSGDPTAIQLLRPFTDLFDTTDDGLVFDTNGSCETIRITGLTPANSRTNAGTQFGIFRDREEGPSSAPASVDFSPPPPGGSAALSLCYEAQVVSFNQTNVGEGFNASTVLGSRYARNINLSSLTAPLTAGWVKMKLGLDSKGNVTGLGNTVGNFLLDGDPLAAGVKARLFGLPATGFYALKVARAAGALANYGGLWRHRGSRRGDTTVETIASNGFVPGCTTLIGGVFSPCPNVTSTVLPFGAAGTFALS